MGHIEPHTLGHLARVQAIQYHRITPCPTQLGCNLGCSRTSPKTALDVMR